VVLTISCGYDPGYLKRYVATGRENYYLSAVAEHGEPPGIWTGMGCPELALPVGSEVDNAVMERLYGKFIDPRDQHGRVTLGRAPSGYAGNDDKVAARIERLLATEPEATRERRDQLIMQALKEQRAAVYFFDATFSVPKSVSCCTRRCSSGPIRQARAGVRKRPRNGPGRRGRCGTRS